VGAVGSAALLPRLRARLPPGTLLAAGSLGLAAVALITGFVHVAVVVGVALAAGGLAWILALSVLNSVYQLSLPGWVKARGMAFYLVVFQSGNVVGSAVMGIVASHAGLSVTLLAAAAGLALSPLLGLVRKFQPITPADLVPAGDWPDPQLADGGAADSGAPAGPVLVTVEYRSRAGQDGDLIAALRDTRFSRRRTGASSWRVWQDASDPGRVVEQFTVASWPEHLRQHERVTARDQARLDRVRASETGAAARGDTLADAAAPIRRPAARLPGRGQP
jgi:hypothetical protein